MELSRPARDVGGRCRRSDECDTVSQMRGTSVFLKNRKVPSTHSRPRMGPPFLYL